MLAGHFIGRRDINKVGSRPESRRRRACNNAIERMMGCNDGSADGLDSTRATCGRRCEAPRLARFSMCFADKGARRINVCSYQHEVIVAAVTKLHNSMITGG